MELLTRVVIVVWCSTLVRYTFAEGDLMKKTCLNKKCTKVSNPFGIAEIDPTAVETRLGPGERKKKMSRKSGDLFDDKVNVANVKKITEVFDNGFYSALCWIEITTITEYKNGSNNVIREYAISFESPSDIPNAYLDKVAPEIVPYKIFDQDTKKSEVINFTTIKASGDVTVRQNRKVLCGSGPIYTKEYFQWLNSNKKKIELRVSPKKQSLVASECTDDQEKSDGENTESDVTVRQENLDNIQQKETISKVPKTSAENLNNSSSFSTSTVPVSQKVDKDSYKVTTQAKLLPNDETTSITVRLGSENFRFSDQTTTGNHLHVSPNLNKHGYIDEEDIVYKIKSGLGTETDSTVSSLPENYSINSEKFLTSTERTSFNSEAISKKFTTKLQLDVTKASDDFSFGSTKNENDYEGKSTTYLHPLTEGTTLDVEKSTMYVNPDHSKGSTKTNFDNSKNTQSTEFNEKPSTLSSEVTVSSTTVTEVPILNTSSQKIENVNTPKPPERETFNTEKSESTSSMEEIKQTTMEEANVTTSLPQNVTVSNTDSPLTVTETSKEFSTVKYEPTNDSTNATVPNHTVPFTVTETSKEFSTVKSEPTNDSTNATVPNHTVPFTVTETSKEFSTVKSEPTNDSTNAAVSNQFSTEKYQHFGIPLNETVEKISVRVNVLADHIVEGIKNGKVFRNITPIIGVEKKVEFYIKFKDLALETYKKELGYNWNNFIEHLILQFFGNRTNGNPNGLNDLNNINTGGCKNKVVNTGESFVWGIPKKPTPELAYNKFNALNSGNQFLTSKQQVNSQHLFFQNQQKPSGYNKYKEKFDSIHTFTYPPIGKLVNYSQNSAILFKNKQPVFRLDNLITAKNATANFVNSSSSNSNLKKKPTSVMLQKVLNLTKTVSAVNFRDGMKNGSSSHRSDNTTNFNKHESTAQDIIGNQINSSLLLASDKTGNEKSEFKFMDPSEYILQKLRDFSRMIASQNSTTENTSNSNGVQVEEKNENNTNSGLVNNISVLVH